MGSVDTHVLVLVLVRGQVIFGTPKTHKRRVVPFPAFLSGPLTELIAGRGPDELLFTAPGGGALRNTNFRSRIFEQAKVDLGLGALRIHDLRHTAASLPWLPEPTSRSSSGCSATPPRL